jgi:hypothetical protein
LVPITNAADPDAPGGGHKSQAGTELVREPAATDPPLEVAPLPLAPDIDVPPCMRFEAAGDKAAPLPEPPAAVGPDVVDDAAPPRVVVIVPEPVEAALGRPAALALLAGAEDVWAQAGANSRVATMASATRLAAAPRRPVAHRPSAGLRSGAARLPGLHRIDRHGLQSQYA